MAPIPVDSVPFSWILLSCVFTFFAVLVSIKCGCCDEEKPKEASKKQKDAKIDKDPNKKPTGGADDKKPASGRRTRHESKPMEMEKTGRDAPPNNLPLGPNEFPDSFNAAPAPAPASMSQPAPTTRPPSRPPSLFEPAPAPVPAPAPARAPSPWMEIASMPGFVQVDYRKLAAEGKQQGMLAGPARATLTKASVKNPNPYVGGVGTNLDSKCDTLVDMQGRHYFAPSVKTSRPSAPPTLAVNVVPKLASPLSKMKAHPKEPISMRPLKKEQEAPRDQKTRQIEPVAATAKVVPSMLRHPEEKQKSLVGSPYLNPDLLQVHNKHFRELSPPPKQVHHEEPQQHGGHYHRPPEHHPPRHHAPRHHSPRHHSPRHHHPPRHHSPPHEKKPDSRKKAAEVERYAFVQKEEKNVKWPALVQQPHGFFSIKSESPAGKKKKFEQSRFAG